MDFVEGKELAVRIKIQAVTFPIHRHKIGVSGFHRAKMANIEGIGVDLHVKDV